MATQQTIRREVHLLHLAETLRTFQNFCGAAPEIGAAWAWSNLQAKCVQCGIALTDRELAALLDPNTTSPTEGQPRLRRIRQGYCARRSCDAYFYEVTFTSNDPGVESLWANASEQVSGQILSGSAEIHTSRFWQSAVDSDKGRDLLKGAGVMLALGLILWWNFRTPGWASRPSGYRPDPTSVAEANFQTGP